MPADEEPARALDQAAHILAKAVPGLQLLGRRGGAGRALQVFRARRGQVRLHVEVRFLSQVRVRELVGQLAAGGLEARQAAAAAGDEPVILAVAPRAGRESLREAERFMARYLPEVSWGVLDLRGGVRLRLPPLGLDLDQPRVPAPRAEGRRRAPLSFSDLNRWMLKILLLREAPEGMWGGPRAVFLTPAQLHDAARVSPDKAYKFLRMLEEQDFLRRTPDGFALVRRAELVEHWFAAERLHPPRRLPVRDALGKKPDPARLAPAVADGPRAALGGFAACRLLGASNASGTALELHVRGDPREYLAVHGLEACHPDAAGLNLLVSEHPQSVFRGAVRRGPVLVVDVLQAALDVVPSPARGLEQAQYILEHVLGVR